MFHRKVYVVEQKGMASLNYSHDELVQVEDYNILLHDLKIEKSKFVKVKGVISGQIFRQGIMDDLFISHEVHHLFICK